MLTAAFVNLGIAVLLGTAIAVFYLRTGTRVPAPWPFAALHGIFAIGGLACLVLALQGPPRGLDRGTASFGAISATLLALAALAGGAVLTVRLLKQRRPGTLIALHATLAVSGFVILAAYVLV